MRSPGIRKTLCSALLACLSVAAPAQYPRIASLDRSDALFLQQQQDVERYYRQASASRELPALLIYRYEVTKHDTLFGIAARLSLPYSAIATLNRLTGPSLDGVATLLLPGIPGLFVPLTPRTDLEYIMAQPRRDLDASVVTVVHDAGTVLYRFFAGADFLPDERRSFLGLMFRHPVENPIVSSPYGLRLSPLTAQWSTHAGVDFAAPVGTPVYAARAGTVAETGYDAVMGNYVLIDHSGGFQTFYGHLHSVVVALNAEVGSGMMIGTVGSTGQTTGSHLHFEIRQNGRHRDPLSVLP